jgi:predicted enzyme related to lactoylglutathione lyase
MNSKPRTVHMGPSAANRFCWVDLAATHADAAKRFYAQLFGWQPVPHSANGGLLHRLRLGGQDVGSMYQLPRLYLEQGVSSHWTAYVQVDNIQETVERAIALGAQLVVPPFVVTDMARIALIVDAVGAPIGLWEPLHGKEEARGRC